MTIILIIQVVLLSFLVFWLAFFAYNIVFYGFTPFLPSRPEEIRKIIKEIRVKRRSVIYSLGGGSSGFLMVMENHYPNIELIGIENNPFFYLADRIQVFLKKSRVKVVRSDYYWAKIRKADIIYCYLSLKEIREINKKLKIDTKPNALIISNGFVVPYMDSFKIVKLKERKRWFSFFKRGKKVVRTSQDEDKREDKIYYYRV